MYQKILVQKGIVDVDFGNDEEPPDARCTSDCCTIMGQNQQAETVMGKGKEKPWVAHIILFMHFANRWHNLRKIRVICAFKRCEALLYTEQALEHYRIHLEAMIKQTCPQCDLQLDRDDTETMLKHIFQNHAQRYRRCLASGCEESVGLTRTTLAHRWDKCRHCIFCGRGYGCVKMRFQHEKNCRVEIGGIGA